MQMRTTIIEASTFSLSTLPLQLHCQPPDVFCVPNYLFSYAQILFIHLQSPLSIQGSARLTLAIGPFLGGSF